ncbi:c-type cytochrome [Limnohabitans sp.]|uniref:c-type cytochrome n=1 Tax=Limnohabitans sp. TaxID=1907725 RepID=UPI0038B74CB4
MMRFPLLALWVVVLGGCAYPSVHAKSAQTNYSEKCSMCHDGGAGQAPRVSDTAAWAPRAAKGRPALYQSALAGIPNTAMAAKGGYTDLSDQEVRDLVDLMLKLSGHDEAVRKPPKTNAQLPMAPSMSTNRPASRVAAAKPPRELTDLEISTTVAERLRKNLGSPNNTLDEYEGIVTVRGVGIKVRTEQGVTTLTGSLKEAAHIEKAHSIAAATTGVTQVVNKLIAASVFEWD